MNDIEKLKAFQTYFDLMSMNGGARIYHTARQLGVFESIRKGSSTVDKIANDCHFKEKPTKLLLDALCSLKVLECKNHCYALTPVMHFFSGNYQNLSDEYWDYLPKFLETGIPLAKMDDTKESEKQYQAQAAALAWMMKPAAEVAATMLEMGNKRKGLNILDVGAGSAIWSLTFAQKDNGIFVTAIDWPAVLEIAKASAKTLGLSERFNTRPGNYHKVELSPETYDLAIVGNVTHIETPEGNEALFSKIYKTLKTNGEIVIFDIFPGQEDGELPQSLYALGLALRTEKGQVYSCEQLQEFLSQAGFAGFKFSPIEVPPYTMGMLLAKRGK